MIDTLFVIYGALLALMLGLAVTYDARRRARNKAKASLGLDLPATKPSPDRGA